MDEVPGRGVLGAGLHWQLHQVLDVCAGGVALADVQRAVGCAAPKPEHLPVFAPGYLLEAGVVQIGRRRLIDGRDVERVLCIRLEPVEADAGYPLVWRDEEQPSTVGRPGRSRIAERQIGRASGRERGEG